MKLSGEIIKWLKGQVKDSGTGGIVLGLSGGIDSAVVSVLAAKACGGNVLGLIMPCNSSKDDEKDALLVANKFKIKTHKVDLSDVYSVFTKTLHEGNKLAMANLKPRLRMATLYYYANMMNYIVAGTGNKCEIMMGYYTKHGDGGVDILPMGDLLKSEVRLLAVELGIPMKIINKPPSAGLWEGQTDEEEMGFTYAELEKIIKAKEKGKKPGVSKEKLAKMKKMIISSEHKRKTACLYRKKKTKGKK